MKERYEAIDSLRMIACIGIMMMHLRANNNYEITGYFYNTVIPSFTNFVFLFMTVSAFGMCCGYYEKVMKQTISLSDFYAKRFKKILPFFGVLVLIDVVLSPSRAALYEAFADLTLLFGFLPNAGNISVIGVGWFLGLVFVFYLCFPFFCVLLANKKRAWISFAVSLLYNFVCAEYFEVGRSNILYSACFFLTGGLIYLYRKELAKLSPYIAVMLAAVSIVAYYLIGGYAMTCLLVSACLLICAVVVRGGYWRTVLPDSSATSAWKFTCPIWCCSV
jgi:peptidoglycan/LPS O-acetylase OafA/YrhL